MGDIDPTAYPGGGYRYRFLITNTPATIAGELNAITSNPSYYCLPYIETEGNYTGTYGTDTSAGRTAWNNKLALFCSAFAGVGIEYLELGNEIDNQTPGSWTPTVQADRDHWDDYIIRLADSASIIRGAGLGVMLSSHDSPLKGASMWSYLDSKGAFKYIDAVAVHIYPGDGTPSTRAPGATGPDPGAQSADRSMEALAYCRSQLDLIDPKLDLWVTEVGWNTADTQGSTPNPKTCTWAKQADLVHKGDNTGIFDQVLASAAANRVRCCSWFTAEDYHTAETGGSPDTTPMVHTTTTASRVLSSTSSFTLPVNSLALFQSSGYLVCGAHNVIVHYTGLQPSPPAFLGCLATADTTGASPLSVANGGDVWQSKSAWPTFCGLRENPELETPPTQKNSWARMVTVGGGQGLAGVKPTVTTGTVSGQGANAATLVGTTNPNSKATEYAFQYGVTVDYGAQTAWTSAGSGASAVPTNLGVTGLTESTTYHFRLIAQSESGLSFGTDQTFATIASGGGGGGGGGGGTGPVGIDEPITPLTPETGYHYRLVATNSEGTTYGVDRTFITTAPAVEPTVAPPTLVPLNLMVELTTADGRIYRWDSNAADIKDRPFDINFSTAAGDGFAEASCIVPRPVGLDWPDLALLERGKLIGNDATTAYEGRVAGMPRTIGDDGEKIEVQFQGLMSSARDRPFMECYVNRSAQDWQAPSLPLRKANMAGDNVLDNDYNVTIDAGSIHFKGKASGTNIPNGSQTIVELTAPSGVEYIGMQYAGSEKNKNANDEGALLYGTTDDSVVMGTSPWVSTALTLPLPADNVVRTATLATPQPILAMRMKSDAAHSPTVPYHRRLDKIAVYGNHGVALKDIDTLTPQGVLASDVIKDIVARFCPMLDASQINDTDEVLEHVVFDTPTFPFDAFTLLNGYHLFLLAAWEDGKIQFEPADLTTPDWIVRTDELGVSLELQGDTTDSFANGIVVSYTDVDARSQVLWPDDYPDALQDNDPDNEANKEGLELWTALDISVPTTQKGALILGKAALAEFNRPKAPGTITVATGYISDSDSNRHPGWKVRYGQTIAVSNLPNDDPRLITATSWTEEGVLTITLEQPPSRVDAVLARLELATQAAGIG